jgi:hypothetical protein
VQKQEHVLSVRECKETMTHIVRWRGCEVAVSLTDEEC